MTVALAAAALMMFAMMTRIMEAAGGVMAAD